MRIIRNDLDGGLADASRAIELDPSDATAFLDRGGAEELKADYANALKDLTRALELDPKSDEARRGVIRVREELKIGKRLPNKSPEATPSARTPAADAPVAPAVGRASS